MSNLLKNIVDIANLDDTDIVASNRYGERIKLRKQNRICLRCSKSFLSSWCGERICRLCKKFEKQTEERVSWYQWKKSKNYRAVGYGNGGKKLCVSALKDV